MLKTACLVAFLLIASKGCAEAVVERPPQIIAGKSYPAIGGEAALGERNSKELGVTPPTDRRGMYVSVYATNIGQMTMGPLTKNALSTPANLDLMLRFIAVNKINALTLYNLGSIFNSGAALQNKLRSFIASARRVGVKRVEAAGGDYLGFYDALLAYQTASAAESRFDGIVTEIEFWQPSSGTTAGTVVTVINYCKTKFTAAAFGPNKTFDYGVYIGWVNQTQVNTLATAANYLFIHAYVKNPSTAYGYASSRLQMALAANIKAFMIFSAEGNTISAGSEHFMGDWMATTTPDSMATAETTVSAAIPAAIAPIFKGYQWYEYYFAFEYMKGAWVSATPSFFPPAITSVPLAASISAAARTYLQTPYGANALGAIALRGAAGPTIDAPGLLYRAVQQSVNPAVTTAQLAFSLTVTPPKFTKLASCTSLAAGNIVLLAVSSTVSKAAVVASATSVFWVSATVTSASEVPTTSVGTVKACWAFSG